MRNAWNIAPRRIINIVGIRAATRAMDFLKKGREEPTVFGPDLSGKFIHIHQASVLASTDTQCGIDIPLD